MRIEREKTNIAIAICEKFTIWWIRILAAPILFSLTIFEGMHIAHLDDVKIVYIKLKGTFSISKCYN